MNNQHHIRYLSMLGLIVILFLVVSPRPTYAAVGTVNINMSTAGNITGSASTTVSSNIYYDNSGTTYYLDLGASGSNLSLNAAGSVAVDTSTLYVDATNHRVGIGTTGPTAKLEIAGSVYLSQGADRTIKIPTSIGIGSNGFSLNIAAGDAEGSGISPTGGNVVIDGGVGNGGSTDGNVLLTTNRGDVGIRTTTPGNPLEVKSAAASGGPSTAISIWQTSNTSHAGAAIHFDAVSNAHSTGYIRGDLSSAAQDGTGALVLGSHTGGSPGSYNDEITLSGGGVTFAGNINAGSQTTGAGQGTECRVTAGGFRYSTSGCTGSSIRFKENILPMTYGLNEIMKLQPVQFTYKPSYDPTDRSRKIGLIAEQVVPIIPEVGGWYNGQLENIDYAKLVALVIKGVQDEQGEIKNLQKDLAITTIGDLNISQGANGNYQVTNNQTLVNRIGTFANLITANINAGLIQTKKLIVNGVDVATELKELSDKVDKQGQTINELQSQINQLKQASGISP